MNALKQVPSQDFGKEEFREELANVLATHKNTMVLLLVLSSGKYESEQVRLEEMIAALRRSK